MYLAPRKGEDRAMQGNFIVRGIARATMLLSALALSALHAAPTVFPTGTTLYDPTQADNGFTVLSLLDTNAVIVIDMNGRVVKRWDGFNLSAGGPARILPGGIVIAPQGVYPHHLESTALAAQDFDGKELWRFDQSEEIGMGNRQRWSARQHHDWQRSDFPAGYYSALFSPKLSGGKTLLLTHTSHKDPAIAEAMLQDDRLIEIEPGGRIGWQWRVSDHIAELGFTPQARAAIRRDGMSGEFDWFHMNSATYLGPNRWFDAGDARFNPENVIISSRQASLIAIIARDGSVVWRIGPDFSATPEQAKIGQIIGQHHAHLIPPGLPGAGNLLVFDNGGMSGYGDPSPIAPIGRGIYARPDSRVLEINPVTLELVWSYKAANFFSRNISGAQRLPNGNTLITEGAPGRVFEVTPGGAIVWEYMNAPGESGRHQNAVYRAYRLPYSWLPQLAIPEQQAIAAPDPAKFHVPGTPGG